MQAIKERENSRMNLQQRYSADIWEIRVWDPRGNLGLMVLQSLLKVTER